MKEKIVYTAIIVVYNKKIKESLTCECIRRVRGYNINILIVDNSDVDQDNEMSCKEREYQYISMNGNKGLSKAYNVAIKNSHSDIIILFDDDTEVTQAYFDELDNAVMENEQVDIFAPIVYGQDGIIYSPNEFNFLRNHFISSPEQEICQEKFNAIASCLAIRRRVFETYCFEESLFVDQVDQYFFCQQRQLGKKFMKINTTINQNFYQRGTELSPESGWKRVRLRLIDVARHAKLMGGIKYKILGFVKCCALSLQIAKKTKSIKVLVKGGMLSLKLLFVIPINSI